jgi:hypothetical protein
MGLLYRYVLLPVYLLSECPTEVTVNADDIVKGGESQINEVQREL